MIELGAAYLKLQQRPGFENLIDQPSILGI
jgi:hypothetical protein